LEFGSYIARVQRKPRIENIASAPPWLTAAASLPAVQRWEGHVADAECSGTAKFINPITSGIATKKITSPGVRCPF
jgi:hypothetical protein